MVSCADVLNAKGGKEKKPEKRKQTRPMTLSLRTSSQACDKAKGVETIPLRE
jgi:hypothetical protein